MWVDVNVSLARWPFRRLPLDEPQRLVDKLRSLGIGQAWAGSFDALLHRDIAAVNTRLADDCRQFGDQFLLPMGTANPTLPDWEEDLRRCAEVHGMRGLRLFPNYHGYTLDDPRFGKLLERATELELLVQIAVSMEDERTQHPLVRVAPVDVRPLVRLLPALPRCRILLLNALRGARLEDLPPIVEAGNVSVEIATLEGVAGIEKLLQHVSHEHILLGTGSPFFYPEAAVLKLQESELGGGQREAIVRGNADRLLAKRK